MGHKSVKRAVNKGGFTLVEVLVGMGLLATVLTVGNVLLYTTFKNARKAAAIAAAKTEGSYAVRAMDQMIRYARSVNCVSNTILEVTRLNNEVITYSLSGTKIASTSGGLSRDVTSSNVVIQPCAAGVFACEGSVPPRSVNVCLVVEKANAIDVSEKAGAAGITFSTQSTLRNWGL